jgi:2-oxoisovalerate dehydrogenase E1 component alpha subunit
VRSFRSSPADSLGTPCPQRVLEPHSPSFGDPCEPVRYLNHAGELTSAGARADISLPLAQQFYRDMALARRLDEEALALQRQGELGLWLMSLGQEAAQVGSIRALGDRDYVFPTYREHAAALCRGIGPTELLVQWRGNQHCGWNPSDYRFHFYSLVLGTQTLHATGYAIGVQRDRTDEVVLCYLGDGASSQGDVSEALNWATVMHAPVVFFCQNNQWAISTPASAQTAAPLHHRAAGFGLDSYVVDGNDVLAVHAVTRAAADRVRNGGPPAFIEAITYRMGGHSTSDDPTKYRVSAEVEVWKHRDPIERLKAYLVHEKKADHDFFEAIEGEADELAAEVREGCLSMPDPSGDSMFDHIYVEPHPLVEAERAEFAAYHAGFEGEGSH